jgi:asparagine synthase (glutamine-hydrolysing)
MDWRQMTGSAIYGIIGKADSGKTDRAEAEGIGRRLAHRGTYEIVWSPAPNVWLGWRLQSPPPVNVRPPAVPLIFSGAITNRQELATLIGRGATEASAVADAELLGAVYHALGPETFARINGQFAIALLDPASGALVLAADRWAAQPLYLTVSAGRSAFASEYKALLACDGIPVRPDRDAIGYLQCTKFLPRDRTLLADVRPVPPNGWIRLTAGACERFFYPRLSLDVAADRSEEAHAAELRDAILGAARRLTEGVDRVGIALSAGLDSAVTLGAVRAVAPDKPVYTFTAAFHPDDPDLGRAAEAARHFGTTHEQIVLSPETLPELLPRMVWAMEDPVAREEMLVYHVLAKRAAKHVPLVLYGHLADILFAGMPRHLLVKLASDLPPLRGPITEFYDYTQIGTLPRSLLGRLLVAIYYRGRQTPPPRALGASAGAADKGLDLAASEPLNTSLLAGLAGSPTEVAAMERLHAAVGIRYGSLFHDQVVARCAFRTPDRLKIRGWSHKYILRRAAVAFLPEEFTARPKGMLRLPRDERLTRVLETMAAELFRPQAGMERNLLDVGDIADLRRKLASGRPGNDLFYHIWTSVLTAIWARTFLDQRGAAPVMLLQERPSTAERWRHHAPEPVPEPAGDGARTALP